MKVLSSEIRYRNTPLPSGYYDNKLKDPPVREITYPKDHYLEKTKIANQFQCAVCGSIYCFAMIDDSGNFHPNGWILSDERWTLFEPSCNFLRTMQA